MRKANGGMGGKGVWGEGRKPGFSAAARRASEETLAQGAAIKFKSTSSSLTTTNNSTMTLTDNPLRKGSQGEPEHLIHKCSNVYVAACAFDMLHYASMRF